MEEKQINNTGIQAKAPATIPIGIKQFEAEDHTRVYWLGNGGAMVNSRGTCIMLDPVLEGFDMSLLVDAPLKPEEAGHLDAVLITHCDNDHFSRPTCRKLAVDCKRFDAPNYVAFLLGEEGIRANGHRIHESFQIGSIRVTLTPADHNWQNESKKHATRYFSKEDYCGYWLETEDGVIWMVGDSRLMEEQLHMTAPNLIFLDFSDSKWHIGLEGAVKLCNAYPEADIIPIHWGCVNAPKWPEFNGDPEMLKARILYPERVHILAPGEAYEVKR